MPAPMVAASATAILIDMISSHFARPFRGPQIALQANCRLAVSSTHF